jgi:Na+/H+ antiporter NhaD/arsenite permease-like protein
MARRPCSLTSAPLLFAAMSLSPHTQQVLMWLIFAVTYIGIALGRFPKLVLDRTGIALLGAIAMLLVNALSIEQAAAHVDYPTMLLLFGLMIFSAQLRVAGFYVTVGGFLTKLTDRPRLLLAGVIATSAVLSALLANDIVCLAFTPLLCSALIPARKDPIPYLLALATSSNIGSAATLIGNPQNMYIGTVAGLPFAHFAGVMLPPVLVGLGLCYVAVVLLFGGRIDGAAAPDGGSEAPAVHETLYPSSLPVQKDAVGHDRYLIIKTLVLLAGLVGFFIMARGPHAGERRSIAALVGAALLLCSHRAKAARLYQLVDFNLILLFLGLFVVNGAMQQRHLTDQLFTFIAKSHVDLSRPGTLAAVTTALSNLISNVPAVLLLRPAVAATAQAAHTHQAWYLLALVSTWAGNLTLVGSIANLIVAEQAAAFGVRLNLWTYCTVGIPLTLVSIVLGTLWLAWVM